LSYVKSDVNNPAVKKILEYNQVLADGALKEPATLKQWHPIWLAFAIYALIVAVLFAIFFRHKHDPKQVANVQH
jgi:NHS family xanthosine MFS transporter